MPQVNVQCQTIDVGMTAQFWLNNPTNVNFHVTMDGVTVLSGSGMGDSNSPCGPVLSMSTTVPIDTTHEYLVEWGPLAYCQWALPGDDRVSGFFVSGIPNCAVVTFRDWYTNVHDTTWWIEEDHDLGYFYFSVNTNLGKVKFDVCDDSLPADGRSKAGAYLQADNLVHRRPRSWLSTSHQRACYHCWNQYRNHHRPRQRHK